MKENIIFMPHANIQYSQLHPGKRHWVMKNCYEKIFDVVAQGNYRIAFEASGRTIEEMAKQAPEVLEKLKSLLREGQVEAVGSPYTHCMLGNIPARIGLMSLKHGLDAWEKYTGVRPVTGWNPECGWTSYIPQLYKQAGFETLIMDADSFFLSFDEIREATGLSYDVQGHSNKSHLFKIEEYIKDRPEFLQYLTNPSRTSDGLNLLFRADCMANPLLWYLMGATEGMRSAPVSLEEITQMLGCWKQRVAQTGSFVMPYAEDAEYVGSSAYFYVKQFNQARFFEAEPESVDRFREILCQTAACGYEFSTPSQVVRDAERILPNPFVGQIENGVAWHGGTAKAWANTEYSRILDPVCHSIFLGIEELEKIAGEEGIEGTPELKEAMYVLEEAWVSDSRWPPEPTSPGRFNVEESIEDLKRANSCVEQYMQNHGMEKERAIYSPRLMRTQIRYIEQILMERTYFGE